ncbi:MAG: hypothetical protein Q9218_004825 [Villophora microphyllina]
MVTSDVHFSHPHLSSLPALSDASLRFLGTVEVSDVPLYLAAGPSLDVWTSNEQTQKWLHTCLRSDYSHDGDNNGRSWWENVGGQSKHGILLGVDGGLDGSTQAGPNITEILLYTASSNLPERSHAPLTPPESSPKYRGCSIPTTSSIRLYATPLSSKIFKTIDQSPATVDPDAIAVQDGYYLPSPPEPSTVQSDNPKARKRAKIETLFNDATQNRRAQKKRGGEGVSKAMAGIDGNITIPLPSPVLLIAPETKNKPAPKRAVLSRALTTGSLTQPPPNENPIHYPHGSRRSTLTNNNNSHPRSSLHRVESVLSPTLNDIHSPIPEDNTPNNDIESQNKTALSRIIMAGMRMYGLQQQRKKSLAALETQSQASSSVTGDQDEYKAVYHQTFKAAAFVFRKTWRERVVGQDVLRDTVDLFLGKFCQDPFTKEDELENALNLEFGI